MNAARDVIYQYLMTDGIHGRGHTPERSEQASTLLDAHRDAVAAAIVAGLAAIHDHPETAERDRPGLRMAMRNVHRFAETTPLGDTRSEGNNS